MGHASRGGICALMCPCEFFWHCSLLPPSARGRKLQAGAAVAALSFSATRGEVLNFVLGHRALVQLRARPQAAARSTRDGSRDHRSHLGTVGTAGLVKLAVMGNAASY